MHHRVFHFHVLLTWHYLRFEQLILLLLALFVFIAPVSAAMRFQERSLYMQSTVPGATTKYITSWRFMSPQPVGSVEMLFCIDPIPYHDCVTPPGLDVSGAVLSAQTGETGFSILSQTTNRIVLTRLPSMISGGASAYTFDNVVNPTDVSQSFSIRLKSLSTTDGTGAQIDFGSIKGQVTDSVLIETQVPPMLIFCLAQTVADNCESTNEVFYTNMGQLDEESTLVAQSQMAVGTNATGGFVITANGIPPSAGVNYIQPIESATGSVPGTNQFGINLVANTEPAVGNDPQGTWANAIPAPDYSVPNQYKFVSGDAVAYSPNVSLMKKFTVSYIMNAGNNLRAGVYSTTITYIASGRF